MIRVKENKIMYHVSKDPITKFDVSKSAEIGLHVGDIEVARDIAKSKYGNNCHVYEVSFNDDKFKVVNTDNAGRWSDPASLSTIIDRDNPKYMQYYNRVTNRSNEVKIPTPEFRSMVYRDLLDSEKCNGIKYLNTAEGTKDSYSYILTNGDNVTLKEIDVEDIYS